MLVSKTEIQIRVYTGIIFPHFSMDFSMETFCGYSTHKKPSQSHFC